MKTPILVKAHPETNEVITMKSIINKETGDTREVGNIMVQQAVVGNLSGIGRLSKRTAFITLEKEVVDLLRPMITAETPFPVDGKICIEETLTPYIKSNGQPQEPKIDPRTNEVITFQGSPVYRNTFFTEVMSTQDVLLRDAKSADEGSNEAPE